MAYIDCKNCGKKIDSRAKTGKCQSCYIKDREYSEETKEKMRQAKLENPTRYWKGKERSEETKQKISKANKGNTAWNKGRPWSEEVKKKMSEARKGIRVSPETEFKKGIIPHNKGKFGDSVHSAHNWAKSNIDKSDECDFCGSKENLEWSNKSHEYKKEEDDWQYLCRGCHMSYDYENHGCRKFIYE